MQLFRPINKRSLVDDLWNQALKKIVKPTTDVFDCSGLRAFNTSIFVNLFTLIFVPYSSPIVLTQVRAWSHWKLLGAFFTKHTDFSNLLLKKKTQKTHEKLTVFLKILTHFGIPISNTLKKKLKKIFPCGQALSVLGKRGGNRML